MKNADKKPDSPQRTPAAENTRPATEHSAKITDERPATLVQRKLQQQANAAVQQKANNTGLPDQLKAGIENLSGYAMDDVTVHRNSAQPAQLNAHAYAQGTDIHLAPGQEKHLPHEAWHVAQQKQGRVQPTRQLQGKVAVNDDVGLEREADVMGGRAMRNLTVRSSGRQQMLGNNLLQAVIIEGEEFPPLRAAYHFFTKKVQEAKNALTLFDEKNLEPFDSAAEFMEAFLKVYPEFAEHVDPKVMQTHVQAAKDKIVDERSRELKEKFTKRGPVRLKANVDKNAVMHAYERHTKEGIISVREIKSATSGDVAIFPYGFEYSNMNDLADRIQDCGEVIWLPREKGGVKATMDIDKMTIMVYGDNHGKQVEVETFFPLNREVARDLVSSWWK